MYKKRFQLLPIFFLMIMSYAVKAQTNEPAIVVKYVRNKDNSVSFNYVKNRPGTYKLKITFSDFVNTNASDYEELIKYDSGSLLTLRPDNKESYINFGYSVSYVFGNPEPKVDSLFHYVLPFKKGKNIVVYENSNLNEKYFGAGKVDSWKSYCVTSKTPDTIYAMRKGIVVEVKNEFATDTLVTGYVYSSKRNSVTIEHEDGTYSSYKGLKMNSFFVKLGETVYPATPLGVLDRFNNKTYDLHFMVYYIGKKDYIPDPKATLKTAKTAYDCLSPYFYTTEGLVKIIPKNKYTVDCNQEIITKEMTKREVKQFLKNNNTIK